MKRVVLKIKLLKEDVCGFTLIEVLLSLTIGIVIISLVFELFIFNQHSYHMQTALNKIQMNAARINHLFQLEIHLAGYIGCPKLTKDFPLYSFDPKLLNAQNKILTENNQLTISRAAVKGNVLLENMPSLNILFLSKDVRYAVGDILLISDCNKAEIFKVKKIHYLSQSQLIESEYSLHELFLKQAEVSHLIKNTFYIERTNRVNKDGSPIDALFIKNLYHQTSEIVSGVSQMSISINSKGVDIEYILHEPPYHQKWYLYAKKFS